MEYILCGCIYSSYFPLHLSCVSDRITGPYKTRRASRCAYRPSRELLGEDLLRIGIYRFAPTLPILFNCLHFRRATYNTVQILSGAILRRHVAIGASDGIRTVLRIHIWHISDKYIYMYIRDIYIYIQYICFSGIYTKYIYILKLALRFRNVCTCVLS